MPSVYVSVSMDRIEVGRGDVRAQFMARDNFWVPVGMWQGNRPMLNFKDQEWLSLGRLRPTAIDCEVEEDPPERAAVRFWGEETYFGVPVEWSVVIEAALRWPGLTITTEIVPRQTIEVAECFSRFATPSDYDGNENVLCVIGQSPVTVWQNGKLVAGVEERWRSATGRVNAPCARAVLPTRAPICCFRAGPDIEGDERYISIVGHWDVCSFRTVCVVPTAFAEGRRGYEFLVGVLDWRCGEGRKSVTFLEGERRHCQRLSIAFSNEIPGGTLDRWLFGVYERSIRLFFPATAEVEADQRARSKKVELAKANEWLIEALATPAVGLCAPEAGMVNYTEGTHPDGGHYSFDAIAPWLSAMAYQAHVTRRDDLHGLCELWAERLATALDGKALIEWTANDICHELLPTLRCLTCFQNNALRAAMRRVLEKTITKDKKWAGTERSMDLCIEALRAETLFLAGQIAGKEQLIEAAMEGVTWINAQAQDRFWQFGCTGELEADVPASRIRPLGLAHGILCNLSAYKQTRREEYMEMAGTFARYLVSICCATFNDSTDPDFDTRGFANGAGAGRHHLRECDPAETSEALRAVAYWLSFRPDNSAGFYDLLWLLSRTFCGIFPAARTLRRGCDASGRTIELTFANLPDETAGRRFPYIAWEDPCHQVGQSPRASVEALYDYLVFGGGLASCDNERLLVLSPRAAGYDIAERVGRFVLLYNPADAPENTLLTVHHLPAQREYEVIVDNRRLMKGVAGDKVANIPLEVPSRRVVAVQVDPTRVPTAYF